MASSKEIQQPSRPLTHRPSLSSTSVVGGLTPRQSHARANSHSVVAGAGSLNASHRVSRRKSMTNPAANVAAVAAAMQEAVDQPGALPILGARRNTMSRGGFARSGFVGSLPSPPASLPTHRFVAMDGKMDMHPDSAIDDDSNDMSDGEEGLDKARARRASDGQALVKERRKSNRVELRCEKCGKGYKHSSCLSKHLWEHTPEWSYTSKLLISKHQQVQLLEAASVLVAMNNDAKDASTPPDSARDFASDRDSASPAASGYSDQNEGRSSANTTPPPQLEGMNVANASFNTLSKRYSSGSGFSRSYQSAPSVDSVAGSVPSAFGWRHYRQASQEQRPPSSGRNATGQEDRDLAAAVETLSCSFGSTSGSRTVHLARDVPPVPPLPAQYASQATPNGGTSLTASYLEPVLGTSFIGTFPSGAPESFTRGERADVKMEESGDSAMDDDDDDEYDDMQSRARSDEDDDGVFGRMEE